MDDIDLIRELGSEFPGPDAGETARARARLAAAVNAAPPTVDDREERQATGGHERPAAGADRRPRRHAAVRRRRLVLAACAAAAVAAAALIVPGLFTRTPLGGVQSAAAAALNKAADVAAGQAATAPPKAGQFVYTKTKAVWESTMADVDVKGSAASQAGASPTPMTADNTINVLMPVTREIWIAPDGRGRLLETNGTPTFLTAQDKAVWEAAGRPDLGAGKTSDQKFGKGGLYYLDLSKVPTDTAQLRAMIVERKIEGGPAGDAETFTIVGDLLRETSASPALRAALYQVASQLHGVELIGTVKDEAGRTGTAVGYTSNGYRNELIFDPTTAALLGEQSVVADSAKVRPHLPVGTVMSWSVYLASGVVDSTSQTPQTAAQ